MIESASFGPHMSSHKACTSSWRDFSLCISQNKLQAKSKEQRIMQIGWSRIVERRNEPVAFHRKWRSRIPRKGNPCVTKKTHQLTNACDARDELCETIRRLL
jgi:hypothetical protein